jgi:ubiquinone/menaquinone biosynthesis C-methylase UbiE
MDQKTAQKILEETKVSYNQIAEHFSVTRVWPWKVMEAFFSYLKPNNCVLDIGCGNGRLYEAIKDKNVEYVGIDNSEELINLAKKKFGIMNEELVIERQKADSSFIIHNSSFLFVVADALEIPFKDEEFNNVFMMAVLPHIPSQKLQLQALENVYRVLKKDGYLFITSWNFWQPKLFWKNLKNRIKNPKLYNGLGWNDFLITWRNSQREILSQRFYHAFTQEELKRLLEKTGFKVEQIYYEYKGEKSSWLKGFNLVVIAKK